MLVLSRKKNESIVIDDVIKISVLSIQGNKVRLGITAPDNVTVDREEIAQRREFSSILTNNIAASDCPCMVVEC